MILANTRQHLSRDDAQLALRLLARASGESIAEFEHRLTDEGIDALLDDPRLPAVLLHAPQAAHTSFPLFAYVMVRHALRRMGEGDRGLADYVAAILVHFGVRERAFRLAESDDQVYRALTDLVQDANDPDPQRAFLVRTHLGNYALWLSGLFPDHVEQRRWRRGGPDLAYYEELGKRGFQLAAEHRLAEQHGLATLYATAAERFGLLRLALNTLSDWLFFPNVHTPERLMRQVADEARWRMVS
ncbi:MAG TPA: hypothetical protein VJU87_06930 [Gemmatimonadaceae bacterium]|nr:hypothetical protein [Gemmatimonadaceae bacterium]